jgi:putative methyltransferase (TIGR04325 family)
MKDLNEKLKYLFSSCVPPILFRFFDPRTSRKGVYWLGDYASWEEAIRASKGYDDTIILERIKEAALKVKKGEAVYERDGFLFDEIQYSWPVLAGLLWVAAQSKGELNLIDFGGSLGTAYFQNRLFLQALSRVRWSIVEQRNFVDVGKQYFEDQELIFYYDLETCVQEEKPNAILISSVLPYLQNPYEILREVISYNFDFIILDRTPLFSEGKDRLTVQVVPPEIYPSSYPSWFLNRNKFYSFFKEEYDLIARFESLGKTNLNAVFEGCILRRSG